ncbi:MAG: glycosyl hydrolase family 18 protein [Oscillospiraceae bacterium]
MNKKNKALELTLVGGAVLLVIGLLILGVKAIQKPQQELPPQTEEDTVPQQEQSSEEIQTEEVPEIQEEKPQQEKPTVTKPTTNTPQNKPTPPVQEKPTPSPPPAPTPQPILPKPTPSTLSGNQIVGYYAYWGNSKGFPPSALRADLLTHINYAFATIDKDFKIAMANPSADKQNFAELRELKAANPHLKTLISIGGWDYSGRFSDAALSELSRETFAQSCLDFILIHGFDGIDLDWEYPVSGGLPGKKRPEDKQNYTKLLAAIRTKLNEQSDKDGKKYLLTIAGAPSNDFINKIEAKKIASLVDYIFIMGYDMHGPWDSYADLTAPLYLPQENSPHYKLSVESSVNIYLSAGVPAKKLILGMPFYGYSYQVNSSDNDGLYSTFSGGKSVGYDTVKNNYLNSSDYEQFYHSNAEVPYLFGNNTFVSFEDKASIAAKANLAKDYGLGGVGAWELSHDTGATLLKAAYNALN